MNLSKHIDVEIASTTVVGLTDSTFLISQNVDLQGYEGCLFIGVGSTDFCIGAGTTLQVQGSSANSTSAMITYSNGLTVSKTTVAGANNRLILADLYKPLRRYNRVRVPAAATSGACAFIAVKYGARHPGSTTLNDSTTIKASGVILGAT